MHHHPLPPIEPPLPLYHIHTELPLKHLPIGQFHFAGPMLGILSKLPIIRYPTLIQPSEIPIVIAVCEGSGIIVEDFAFAMEHVV